MKNVVISVVLLEGYAVHTAIKQHLTVQFSCLHNNMIHHWYQNIYFGEIKNVPAMCIERTQLPCYLFRYIESNNIFWVHIFDNAIYNCSEFKTKECNKGARLSMNRYMETPQATFFYSSITTGMFKKALIEVRKFWLEMAEKFGALLYFLTLLIESVY